MKMTTFECDPVVSPIYPASSRSTSAELCFLVVRSRRTSWCPTRTTAKCSRSARTHRSSTTTMAATGSTRTAWTPGERVAGDHAVLLPARYRSGRRDVRVAAACGQWLRGLVRAGDGLAHHQL